MIGTTVFIYWRQSLVAMTSGLHRPGDFAFHFVQFLASVVSGVAAPPRARPDRRIIYFYKSQVYSLNVRLLYLKA
jgi:hypothetical protein